MTKVFAIGDIHGAHLPLKQCLERCGFDYENDQLIVLGDICDGWPYVYECVEELRKIKNVIFVVGNHDMWFITWLKTMHHPDKWGQGGKGTAISYLRNAGRSEEFSVEYSRSVWDYSRASYHFDIDTLDVPMTHQQFFMNHVLYYLDDNKRLFVHAGFERSLTLKDNQRIDQSKFYWDRDLWSHALSVHPNDTLNFKEDFKEIFIGHTETVNWYADETYSEEGYILIPGQIPNTNPMHADIIWNLDTGAGSKGKLTIMDINTHEYWQSDNVKDFYGEYKPR